VPKPSPGSNAPATQIRMPLGTAILEVVRLELARREGHEDIPDVYRRQRDLIIATLNETKISIGFDCDGDGVADVAPGDVSEVVRRAATDDSCCRTFLAGDEPRPDSGRSR